MYDAEPNVGNLPQSGLQVSAETRPRLTLASQEEGTEENRPVNPFRTIHRILRGRYRLVLFAATVLAIAGGVAGYLAAKPEFVSIGMIHIAPRQLSVKTRPGRGN